jgi:hypothetical protein
MTILVAAQQKGALNSFHLLLQLLLQVFGKLFYSRLDNVLIMDLSPSTANAGTGLLVRYVARNRWISKL